MSVTIYHNPKCSKSRQTLALLQEQGIEPRIVEYLDTPPTAAELDAIVNMLGIEPQALLRKREAKEADLEPEGMTRKQLIAAMVKNPRVIERPIVVNGKRAALGRPPESVLEIL